MNVFLFSYPIGGDTDYHYIILETHYDNPAQELGFIDKLTMRYYLTKQLQKNELGTLLLGTTSSGHSIAIPPKENSFTITSNCVKACTDAVIYHMA